MNIIMSKVINLLNRVLNNSGKHLKKQNEYMYWSPFIQHHKPKLQINVQTGKWHCWVSNQGGHNLFQLFKKIGANRQHFEELKEITGDFSYSSKKKDDKVEQKLELPKEFLPLWKGSDNIVKRHALYYLEKRGITQEDILKYNIGYCDEGLYSNRIIIPSYDENGNLNFFVGRDFYKSPLKYRNTPTTKDVVGFELFINWDEPIILCEGVFDAMAFRRNAIPLFGKTIMNNLQKKIIDNRVKTIYLALDNDAIKDAIKISDNFINNGIDVRMMKFKEKDPSEIGFKNLINLINNTNQTKFSDIMKMKLKGF
tara:strand:+ start:302 stop:1234 length:933 start_codon:yes stop_codon:yes gene_type:complete